PASSEFTATLCAAYTGRCCTERLTSHRVERNESHRIPNTLNISTDDSPTDLIPDRWSPQRRICSLLLPGSISRHSTRNQSLHHDVSHFTELRLYTLCPLSRNQQDRLGSYDQTGKHHQQCHPTSPGPDRELHHRRRSKARDHPHQRHSEPYRI